MRRLIMWGCLVAVVSFIVWQLFIMPRGIIFAMPWAIHGPVHATVTPMKSTPVSLVTITPTTPLIPSSGTTPTSTPGTAPTTIPAGTSTPSPDFVSRVIAQTNLYRAQNGCPPLKANAILMGTAQFHSEDMALNDFVGHDSSDGTKVWDRIKNAGYNYQIVAENAAWGQRSPEGVVDEWFNESPPNDLHRKNILNCALQDIGIGYYYLANDPGTITAHAYWTQDFGKLLNP